ncbi:MAG: serine/threonine protein kinase [Rhodobacteraceae bacterium]|nr:serine/threonine protein kinase [Paracoccaceae bacterium]
MSDQQVPIGTLINNNYKIEQLISAGGMGEVFRGTNVFSGDSVAIKIVLQSLAHDPKVAALFKREAKVLCQLADQAIVRYYNFVHDAALDRFCLIMEFIDGLPLSDHVKGSGPLSLPDAQKLMKRLALGLERAHKMEVVHRDLSPDNVMLKGGTIDDAVLIDFGIAKSTEMSEATLFGQMAGKFKYVSPEQLGHYGGHIGPRTDIYGLALLMAAAVRGEPIDMGSSVVEAVNARREIPDLTGIYPQLQPLFAHMLEPDPAMRPETMGQVIHYLERPQDLPPRYGVALGDDRTVFMGQQQPVSQMPPPPPPASYPPGYAPPPYPQTQPPGYMPPQQTGYPLGVPQAQQQTGYPQAQISGIGMPGATTSAAPFGNNPLLGGMAPPAGPSVLTAPAMATPTKSGGGGMVVGLLLLALLGVGGGFAWQQGYLGGAAPADDPAGGSTDVAGSGSATDPAPTAGGGATGATDPTTTSQPTEGGAPPTREAFLAAFPGDACSYASRVEAGALAGMVEGFATKTGAFAALPAAYETAFGSKPDVKDRVISDPQCPVVEAARAIQRLGAPAPTVTLDSDTLAAGGFMVGQIRERRGRPTWMALITPEGRVFNLTSQLTNQPDGSATFSFGLAASTATAPQPHLIVVIASDDPLTTAIAQDGKLSGDLMPLIRAEIEGRGGKAGIGLAWFAQQP